MQLRDPFRRTVVVGATVLALTGVAAAPTFTSTADGADGTVAIMGAYTGVERLADDDTDPAADQKVRGSWTPKAMQAVKPVETVTDQPEAAAGDDVPTGPGDTGAPSGPLDQSAAEPAAATAPTTDPGH